MERERPPYLGKLARERRGNWMMYVLAAALLAAMIGGWKVYTNTVAAWHVRFESAPAASPRQAAVRTDEASRPRMSEAERIARELEDAAIIDAHRRAEAERIERLRSRASKRPSGWVCVNGKHYQVQPDGTFQRTPGATCE